MKISVKRYFALGLSVASLLLGVSRLQAQETPAINKVTPLKHAFKGQFLIGTALSYSAIQGHAPLELSLATAHFNAFTPENSLKPDAVQPREGEFHFADGDRLVELARQCGATPIGHTLIWHQQTPQWFFRSPNGDPVSRELALARLRTHIATVVGHYKGRIKQWDVVNEALNDGPGLLRETPWLKAIGPDYIAEAFRAAHAADPSAILTYNDYNIELPYKRPKALQLLRSLLDQKVPINAVGIQCHWRMDSPNFAEVEDSINQFAALGLKVMITELDIGVLPTKYQGADITTTETMSPDQQTVMNPYTQGLPEAVARQHAERYRQAFEMFERHKDVIGRVTLWGAHDGQSWLNDFPVRGRTDYPLLFNRQGQPKPAFFAVQETAQASPKPVPPLRTKANEALQAVPGTNPIIRDTFTADPAPLVYKGTVYLYVGHDEAKGDELFTMKEWLCYSSKDMKTWTPHGPIMKATDFKWAVRDAWAAQVVEKNGKFYFYATVQHDNTHGGKAIGVAVSDSPTGPFKDARGSALVTDDTTPSPNPWDDIDPTILMDDDGTAWLAWGNPNCYLAKLKPNMTELDGPIEKIDVPHYTEGPWLHKRKGLYYLTYAAFAHEGQSEKICYATAPKITGPWTYQGILTGTAAKSYTIHPGIIEFKNQWYLFYHNAVLTLPDGESGALGRRSVCIEYLYFNPDGTMKPVVQTVDGVSVPPKP